MPDCRRVEDRPDQVVGIFYRQFSPTLKKTLNTLFYMHISLMARLLLMIHP